MKNELLNLNKIFTDRIFRIPDYQRGYAWKDKQLKDFWSDLVQLETGKNHYIGVLTFEDVSENNYKKWQDDLWIIEAKSFSPLYIVDGQQRLTTSIILIQAIIEWNKESKKINYFSKDDIKKRFISDSKDEGISKSYLFGYEKDNPSYEFLKIEIFNEKSDNKNLIERTIYTNNLKNAKDFFLEKISKRTFPEVEKIYKKLTQHCLFNIYSISEDIDVYIAFETMNNRGKPLSILELLKNRLIFLSTKIKGCEYDKQKLRNIINEAWKTIYHQLGRNKDNPLNDDIFLVNHFFLYFGKDHFTDSKKENQSNSYRKFHRKIFHEYKEYLLEDFFSIKNVTLENKEDKDKNLSIDLIYNYVKNLKNSVEEWFNILNPSKSNYSDEEKKTFRRIHRLSKDIEHSKFIILILAFYQKTQDKDKRITLLNSVERLLFIQSLTTRFHHINRGHIDDSDYLALAARFIAGKISHHGILNELHDSTNNMYSIYGKKTDITKDVADHFNDFGFYNWSGIKYFLYEYEMHLQSISRTQRQKLNWDNFIEESPEDHNSIEHIYPQTAKKNCWSEKFKGFNQQQRNALKHSLGNLLPVSKAKNSSLNNRCFSEKKSNNKNTTGYSYGCYSEIEVAQNEEWTPMTILERGIILADFFQKRWGIKFHSNQQVIHFLGLEFLIKKHSLDLEKLFKENKVKDL